MSLEGKLEIHAVTDVGRKRSHNEDSIASDVDMGIAIVADGMGGYKAGEVASAICVNTLMEELREALPRIRPGETDEETGYTRETLLIKEAIEKANLAIYRAAQSQPQCQGMGTTLVAAAFYEDRVTIAHVGDSRLYRFRDGHLEQITKDHSLLQELIDKGFYTPEEARHSLSKNLVTRAVGIDETVSADLQEDLVKTGDVYLLCSDGLTDLVDDEHIDLTLRRYGDTLADAATALVRMANENGGKDNISVILARVLAPFAVRKSWYHKVFDWF